MGNRWGHTAFAVAVLAVAVALLVWGRPPVPTASEPSGPPTSGTPTSPPSGGSGPPVPGATPTDAPPPTEVPTGPTTGPTPGPTTGPGSEAPLPLPSIPPCLTENVPAAPVPVSVLTFNIHAGLGGGGRRLEDIAREIEAWDADLVLLQEVDRHRDRTGFVDQPTWLGNRLQREVVFGSNVVRPPPGPGRPRQEYGTAILSRHPVISWSNQMLPNQPGLEQRGLLRLTTVIGGQQVNVYNTHLQHTRGNIRIAQMQAVREAVRRDVLATGGSVVLGGDLNATSDSPALGIAYSFLRDPWPVVGVGPGLTVPPVVPRRRIDYVLHDESFEPTSAQVLRSAVSDHRAVRVTLQLTPTAGCG